MAFNDVVLKIGFCHDLMRVDVLTNDILPGYWDISDVHPLTVQVAVVQITAVL